MMEFIFNPSLTAIDADSFHGVDLARLRDLVTAKNPHRGIYSIDDHFVVINHGPWLSFNVFQYGDTYICISVTQGITPKSALEEIQTLLYCTPSGDLLRLRLED